VQVGRSRTRTHAIASAAMKAALLDDRLRKGVRWTKDKRTASRRPTG
jgi:hypothetical protein